MISIIVPVYNAARYLGRCVRSLTAQDYRDIEIILVNDASTDDSLQECRRLASSDPRIKVVDKPVNEGLDLARFSGLDAVSASSDYVSFIDSDDWFEPGILSRCRDVAEKSGADYVQFGIRRVFDRWGIFRRRFTAPAVAVNEDGYAVTSRPKLFDECFISFFGVSMLSVNVCGKLYRKGLLERAGIMPSGLRWGEDLIMNMRLFPYIDKIATINDIGYNYMVGGMTSHYLSQLLPAATEMFLMKEEAIEKYDYHKATYPARVEMKNILRTDICQRIAWRIGSRDENVAYVREALRHPLWERVGELARDARHADDAFTQALGRKDAEALFDICASVTRPHGLKRKIQEAILKINR